MPPEGASAGPIGVFDSGVGGLTVLKSIRRLLPHEDLLYLGDTARVPYGNKAPETIRRYSVNIARDLEARGCKALVIACNTASAFALEAVREAVSMPVLDVIQPVAHEVGQRHASGRIAVLGTRGTVRSGAYTRALAAAAPGVSVVQQACPLLVPLAEEGWTYGNVVAEVARTYLLPLFGASASAPDGIILGCTHYPLLRDVLRESIQAVAGRDLPIHESGPCTALRLAEALAALRLDNQANRTGRVRYLVTDDPEAFRAIGERFLGEPVAVAEHVDVS